MIAKEVMWKLYVFVAHLERDAMRRYTFITFNASVCGSEQLIVNRFISFLATLGRGIHSLGMEL